jgi:hypothetical protein
VNIFNYLIASVAAQLFRVLHGHPLLNILMKLLPPSSGYTSNPRVGKKCLNMRREDWDENCGDPAGNMEAVRSSETSVPICQDNVESQTKRQ